MSDELGNFSMLELFRLEVDNQAAILSEGLLALERDNHSAGQLEALMRAAHSVKGAARMVGIENGVQLAHAMEDSFVAAQTGELELGQRQVDLLLEAVDQLVLISREQQDTAEIERLTVEIRAVDQLADGDPVTEPETVTQSELLAELEQATSVSEAGTRPSPGESAATPVVHRNADPVATEPNAARRGEAVRVSAESLSRLVGLAGEVQVEARWPRPFSDALVQIKHRQAELVGLLDQLHDSLYANNADEYSRTWPAKYRARRTVAVTY